MTYALCPCVPHLFEKGYKCLYWVKLGARTKVKGDRSKHQKSRGTGGKIDRYIG